MKHSLRSGRVLGLAAFFGLLAVLGACSGGPETSENAEVLTGPLQVRTTCFPVDWLVQRIGGSKVERVNILPPGEDPPFWMPSGETIAELGDADLIVINGAEFERWTLTAALPVSKLVDSAEGLDLIHIEGATHSHGVRGEHSHSGTDPHTWSDPRTYLAQAQNVHAALVEADPANQPYYDESLESLKADLEELDREYTRVLAPARGRHLAANHPAYGYLARRYGLDIHSFDFDPGEKPSPEQLKEFMDWAPDGEALVLLWEAPPTPEVVAAFPSQVDHVVLDPLERPVGDGAYDYLIQAQSNLEILEELFDSPGSGS